MKTKAFSNLDDHFMHVAPLAKELAAQKGAAKRIRYRGKPVTPFRIRRLLGGLDFPQELHSPSALMA